jgi:hypothetical protein
MCSLYKKLITVFLINETYDQTETYMKCCKFVVASVMKLNFK